MATELFSITCTTCQARLRVRNADAIGQILACPRCQSMVKVLPPPGWSPSEAVPVSSGTPAEPPSSRLTASAAPSPATRASDGGLPYQTAQSAQTGQASSRVQPAQTAAGAEAATEAANAAHAHGPAVASASQTPACPPVPAAASGFEAQAVAGPAAARAASRWFQGSDAAFHRLLQAPEEAAMAGERSHLGLALARLRDLAASMLPQAARSPYGLYAGVAALAVSLAALVWVFVPGPSDSQKRTAVLAQADGADAAVAGQQATAAQGTTGAQVTPAGAAPATGRHHPDADHVPQASNPPRQADSATEKTHAAPASVAHGASEGKASSRKAKKGSRARSTSAGAKAASAAGSNAAATAGTAPEHAGAGHAASHSDAEGDAPARIPADAAGDDAAGDGSVSDNRAKEDDSQEGVTQEEAGAERLPPSEAEIELDPAKPEPEPEHADAEQPDAAEIEAKLQVPLAAIELPDIALGEAIDILGQLASVRIELDVEALGDAGRSPGDRVRVSLTQTTVAEALAAVLAQYNLAYEVRQGVIWIRPR